MSKESLKADSDCGDVICFNYLSGEPVTGLRDGRPLLVRKNSSSFTFANFMRSQLYSVFASLSIGNRILEDEHVVIERLTGHGGIFKTEGVAQSYLSSAVKAPVTVMKTAGEGDPTAWLSLHPTLSGERKTKVLRTSSITEHSSVQKAPQSWQMNKISSATRDTSKTTLSSLKPRSVLKGYSDTHNRTIEWRMCKASPFYSASFSPFYVHRTRNYPKNIFSCRLESDLLSWMKGYSLFSGGNF